MKEEYAEIIIHLLVFLVSFALFFLIIDLFLDGIFFSIIPSILLSWTVLITFSLIVKAFRLNYKIIKR